MAQPAEHRVPRLAMAWPWHAEYFQQPRGSPDSHEDSLAAKVYIWITIPAVDWRIKSLPNSAGSFLEGWWQLRNSQVID